MTRGAFDPGYGELPRVLPIFPLPGALLLPGGQLPLNIFEPRYLAMIRDALSGERLIGMIQPCEAASDVGAAPVYETGCAGRITSFSETDDGRYLITLTGLIRFLVARELPLLSGYRRIEPDYGPFRRDLEADPNAIDRDRLLETIGAYFDATGIQGDWSAIEEAGDEDLVTSLAMVCPFEGSEKQALLEAKTLPERVETMTAIMEMAVHESGGEGARH